MCDVDTHPFAFVNYDDEGFLNNNNDENACYFSTQQCNYHCYLFSFFLQL